MSVIIRLQNLPWAANFADIRKYFTGLSIPEGGVHIVGGEKGDAFIAFGTDEDARQAMERDGGKIKDMKVKLLLSSRTEMARVIDQARNQNQITLPPPTTKGVANDNDRRKTREKSQSPRRRDREKSLSRDRERRRSIKRERSRSRSPSRRNKDRDSDRRSDRPRRDERHSDDSHDRYKNRDYNQRDSSQDRRKYPVADKDENIGRQAPPNMNKPFDPQIGSTPQPYSFKTMEQPDMQFQPRQDHLPPRNAPYPDPQAVVGAMPGTASFPFPPSMGTIASSNEPLQPPAFTGGFQPHFDQRTSTAVMGNYEAKRPSPTPATSAPNVGSSAPYSKEHGIPDPFGGNVSQGYGGYSTPTYGNVQTAERGAIPAVPNDRPVLQSTQPVYGAEPHARYDRIPEANQAGRSANASAPREMAGHESGGMYGRMPPSNIPAVAASTNMPGGRPRRSRFEPEMEDNQAASAPNIDRGSQDSFAQQMNMHNTCSSSMDPYPQPRDRPNMGNEAPWQTQGQNQPPTWGQGRFPQHSNQETMPMDIDEDLAQTAPPMRSYQSPDNRSMQSGYSHENRNNARDPFNYRGDRSRDTSYDNMYEPPIGDTRHDVSNVNRSEGPGTGRNQMASANRNQMPNSNRSDMLGNHRSPMNNAISGTNRNQMPPMNRSDLPIGVRNEMSIGNRSDMAIVNRNEMSIGNRSDMAIVNRNEMPVINREQLAHVKRNDMSGRNEMASQGRSQIPSHDRSELAGTIRNENPGMNRNETYGMDRNEMHGMSRNDMAGMNRSETPSINRNEIHGMNRNEMHNMNRSEMHGMNRNEMHGVNRNEMHGVNRNEMHSMNRSEMHSTGRNEMHHPSRNEMHGMNRNEMHGMNRNEMHGMNRNEMHGMNRKEMPGMNRNEMPGMNRNEMPGMNRNEMPGMNRNEMSGMNRDEMPGMNRNDMAGRNRNEMPGRDRREMPGMNRHEMAAMTRNDVPSRNRNELPGSNRSEIPVPNRSEMPAASRGETAVSNRGEIPPSNRGEIPPSNRGEIPPSNRGEMPISNRGEMAGANRLPQSNRSPLLTLEIRNLPKDTSNDDLLSLFRGYFIPSDNILLIKSADGKLSDSAFVKFVNTRDCDDALRKNRGRIRNRPVQVLPCPLAVYENAQSERKNCAVKSEQSSTGSRFASSQTQAKPVEPIIQTPKSMERLPEKKKNETLIASKATEEQQPTKSGDNVTNRDSTSTGQQKATTPPVKTSSEMFPNKRVSDIDSRKNDQGIASSSSEQLNKTTPSRNEKQELKRPLEDPSEKTPASARTTDQSSPKKPLLRQPTDMPPIKVEKTSGPRKVPDNVAPHRSNLKPCEEDLCIELKGLPYSCCDAEIIHFFDGLSILDIFIELGSNGQATGVGFVEFATPADFHAALDMTGKRIGHRYIDIMVASKEIMSVARGERRKPPLIANAPPVPNPHPRRPNDNTTFCIAINQVPEHITSRDLGDFFSEIHVVPLAIHTMLTNQLPTGEFFAEFATLREMETSLQRDGFVLEGSRISVVPIRHQEMCDILNSTPSLAPSSTPLLRSPLGSDLPPPRRPLLPLGEDEMPMFRRRGEAPHNLPEYGPDEMEHFDHPEGPPVGRPPFNRSRGMPPRTEGGRHSRGSPRGQIGAGSFRGRQYGGPQRFPSANSRTGPGDFGMPGCVVAIDNLHFRAQLEDILEFFCRYNLNKNNVIRKYNEMGQATAEARVAFSCPDDAHHAVMKLNMKPIMGRSIGLSLI